MTVSRAYQVCHRPITLFLDEQSQATPGLLHHHIAGTQSTIDQCLVEMQEAGEIEQCGIEQNNQAYRGQQLYRLRKQLFPQVERGEDTKMDAAFIKYIEDSVPLTQTTLLALCDYLEATGWKLLRERQYSKVIDGPKSVKICVPRSPTEPTATDAVEAFAEIVSVLAVSEPLEKVLFDIKARMEQGQGHHKFSTHHTLTHINEAGVVIVDKPDDMGICVRLEPKDAIRHAEYILAHRAELEQLQKRLEETWRDVALEVKERFEATNEDGEPFSEATAQGIQDVLESVAGVDTRGYFTEEPTSPAGRWYRSMWDEAGQDTTTYEQQWTPFLRVCHDLQVQDQGDQEAPYDDRAAPHDADRFRYE